MINSIFVMVLSQAFLASSIRLTTPLLIGSMGSIFSERSGVLFFTLEGFMLMGAFFGFIGSYYFGAIPGILIAIAVNLVVALVYAFVTVTLAVDQVVSSLAINIFGLGVTSALIRVIFGAHTNDILIQRLEVIKIPVLSTIPVIGAFFSQNPFTYLGFILVPVVWVIFYKTKWGLKIRAVGENPKAAESMGVNVARIRYISILWAGTFAAVAGASQTVGNLGTFMDNMIAGKGFIAFVAVVLGRFNPVGTFIAVFFFATVDAFQLSLQATGSHIPYQFPLMMPYVLTLIAFFLTGSKAAPKGWGTPYVPEN
jgi:simple sugar transport system permease protein